MKRVLLAAFAVVVVIGSLGVGEAAKKKTPVDKKPPTVAFTGGDRGTLWNFYVDQMAPLGVYSQYFYKSLRGVATDDVSGVKQVIVTFTWCKFDDFTADYTIGEDHKGTCGRSMLPPPAPPTPDYYRQASVNPCAAAPGCVSPKVTITCTNAKRLSCNWDARLPVPYPGAYQVNATAIDYKNKRGTAVPIGILIV